MCSSHAPPKRSGVDYRVRVRTRPDWSAARQRVRICMRPHWVSISMCAKNGDEVAQRRKEDGKKKGQKEKRKGRRSKKKEEKRKKGKSCTLVKNPKTLTWQMRKTQKSQSRKLIGLACLLGKAAWSMRHGGIGNAAMPLPHVWLWRLPLRVAGTLWTAQVAEPLRTCTRLYKEPSSYSPPASSSKVPKPSSFTLSLSLDWMPFKKARSICWPEAKSSWGSSLRTYIPNPQVCQQEVLKGLENESLFQAGSKFGGWATQWVENSGIHSQSHHWSGLLPCPTFQTRRNGCPSGEWFLRGLAAA